MVDFGREILVLFMLFGAGRVSWGIGLHCAGQDFDLDALWEGIEQVLLETIVTQKGLGKIHSLQNRTEDSRWGLWDRRWGSWNNSSGLGWN